MGGAAVADLSRRVGSPALEPARGIEPASVPPAERQGDPSRRSGPAILGHLGVDPGVGRAASVGDVPPIRNRDVTRVGPDGVEEGSGVALPGPEAIDAASGEQEPGEQPKGGRGPHDPLVARTRLEMKPA